MHTNDILADIMAANDFLIMAHRGSARGNVIENSFHSIVASQKEHADIAEVDIIRSTDGIFYLFHEGNEQRLLNIGKNIRKMSSKEIDSLSYYNCLHEKVNLHVNRLSDVLKKINGQTILNIDRSWEYWDTFLDYLDTFDIAQHIILKSPAKTVYLDQLAAHEFKYMYWPIIDTMRGYKLAASYETINLVGIEITASSVYSPLFQDENIASFPKKNFIIMASAVVLNSKTKLYDGFDDVVALFDSPDNAWGKMLDKGINAIQTDWPAVLNDYRDEIETTEIQKSSIHERIKIV